MIKTKIFEAESALALETAVNAFLATLEPKDVLDTMLSAFASSKYGQTKTFTAMVIYKE